MSKYSEKLRDPRWQKKRLKVLERDYWTCQECGDKTTTLHVHHRKYIKGRNPWEYDDDVLITLCETCHEKIRSKKEEIPTPRLDRTIASIEKKITVLVGLKILYSKVIQIKKAGDEVPVKLTRDIVAVLTRLLPMDTYCEENADSFLHAAKELTKGEGYE